MGCLCSVSTSEQSIPYSFGSGTIIIAWLLLSISFNKFVHINSSMPGWGIGTCNLENVYLNLTHTRPLMTVVHLQINLYYIKICVFYVCVKSPSIWISPSTSIQQTESSILKPPWETFNAKTYSFFFYWIESWFW